MSRLQNILKDSQYGYYQISGGTLRSFDLYNTFLDAARALDDADSYASLQNIVRGFLPGGIYPSIEDHPFWDSEECSILINEVLIDWLDGMSPEGYYFGTNQGDGSAFGWWQAEE